MAAVATVINKGGTDKVVILGIRTAVVYPFTAPGWTDLRVGFFLSVTDDANDDLITGLAETITDTGSLTVSDRYWIGVKNNSDIFPGTINSVFAGWSNTSAQVGEVQFGDSVLVSSDAGIATGTNYWRPDKSPNKGIYGGIWDGVRNLQPAPDSITPHFAQVVGGGGAPGYATLLTLRLTRPDGNSNTITITTKAGTHAGDVLFTSTPTSALLQTNLQNFPTTVYQMGPWTFSSVPDALFAYWPFNLSRLRLHAVGFLSVT